MATNNNPEGRTYEPFFRQMVMRMRQGFARTSERADGKQWRAGAVFAPRASFPLSELRKRLQDLRDALDNAEDPAAGDERDKRRRRDALTSGRVSALRLVGGPGKPIG